MSGYTRHNGEYKNVQDTRPSVDAKLAQTRQSTSCFIDENPPYTR